MTSLLAISIGPVQEFIAAGRRAGDLFAGSDLLARLSKAVACALRDSGAELIFPADADHLATNKLLVLVPSGPKPTALGVARWAAENVLWQAWDETRPHIRPELLDADLAENQISGFLEFYAAWIPVRDGYARARQEVDCLLAGRKALRNFEQPMSRAGRPKSPLDPTRDCVFLTGTNLAVPAQLVGTAPLRLKKRETLDAVSLIKRHLGAQERRFPSTSMMAAECILPAARKADGGPEAVAALERLASETDLGADFSDLLFPERQKALEEELSGAGDDVNAQRIHAEAPGLRQRVLRAGWLPEKPAACPAYYAILAADGDRMGKMLGELIAEPTDTVPLIPREQSAALRKPDPRDTHRAFSTALHGFAVEAREIVDRHHGRAVYTGGDDVLALIPINTAIPCAAALKSAFEASLPGGTLSVGVAIAHHLESLQTALEYAREAEREAKKKRNSLAVALHTRGGAPAIAADEWNNSTVENWDQWIATFRGDGLSRGFPYELRQLAREFGGLSGRVAAAEQSARMGERLQQEALRILERKKGGKDSEAIKRVKESLRISEPADGNAKPELSDISDRCARLAEKLVIARFLGGYPAARLGEDHV
jgi:CRISPR-associated protein Cmr2